MKKYKSFRRFYRIKKRKTQIFKNRFFWSFCLIPLILGVGFYFLFFSSFFQVKKIIISGNKSVRENKIRAIVERNLENNILFFTTRSIFLTNLNKVKNDILNNLPKIAEVEISRGFPDVLSIVVIEREGVANFCFKEKCFLIDNEGIIFENQKENFLRIEEKRKEILTLNLGQKVIEKENLEKILKIEKFINEKFEFGIEKTSLFNEKITIDSREGWRIFFDLKKDLEWQFTKLDLVLKEKIPSQRRRELEYIDLRFGDLATFKYHE